MSSHSGPKAEAAESSGGKKAADPPPEKRVTAGAVESQGTRATAPRRMDPCDLEVRGIVGSDDAGSDPSSDVNERLPEPEIERAVLLSATNANNLNEVGPNRLRILLLSSE